MKSVVMVYVVIILAIGAGWVKNIVKLSECDFEAPYKAEILRSIGIIPPIGAIMGYMDIEDSKKK